MSMPKLHPLDNITPEEIRSASQLIKDYDAFIFWRPDWDFISMINLEPPKKDLLPLLRQGDNANYDRIPRKSLVVVQRKNSQSVGRFIVNQTTQRVQEFIRGDTDDRASITVDELIRAEELGKADPGVRARLMREYNIPEAAQDTMVLGDSWSFGYNGPTDQDADYNDKRMINVYYYFRRKAGENQLPHAVGFISLVDLTASKVVRITELPINNDFSTNQSNLTIPERSCNYLPTYLPPSYFRTDIKPYVISQPGPSFKIKGNKVSWQKWEFRVAFSYRTGISLHYITYDDKETGNLVGDESFKSKGMPVKREVMYQLGISEMMIPYADPRPPYYRKSAFDIGEYGLGYFANSLAKGCDCLGDESTNSVQYMDFSYSDSEGNPITIKRTVCVHEEDAGVLHKHTEFRTGKAYLVRSRRLVVCSISSIANYVYLFYYYFSQDGTIQFEVKASGKLITNLLGAGIDPAKPVGYGTRVFPQVNAQYHQHNFSARMDFLVDGQENSVAMNDVVRLDGDVGSSTNPYGNGFTVKRTEFKRSKESVTDINSETSRFWEVFNPNKMNKITGKPVAWKLVPNAGSFPRLLAKKNSFVAKRGGFCTNSVWVTTFNDDEIYASGFYVYQSHGGDGLPKWVARNDSIQNKDIVLWHTFGFTHVPRVEDFPIMPVEYLGYVIKPFNAFESNPALDVPPGGGCNTMTRTGPNGEDINCDKCWWGERRSISTITCEHKANFELKEEKECVSCKE